MNQFKEKIKKAIVKHKILVTTILIVLLLGAITIFVSYAYYQVREKAEIVGSTVDEIPDIEIRILVEDRDATGAAIKGKYIKYPYIPQAGYKYNSDLSYCTNGSKFTINDDHTVTVEAASTELCMLYYDSIADLDITLNVKLQNVDENGNGIPNSYSDITYDALPAVGYKLNQSSSSCTNSATLTYNRDENRLIILSPGKTECTAYMDAVDVDIALKTYIETRLNSEEFNDKMTEIPTNMYFSLDPDRSGCEGDGSSTVSLENQKIVIKAATRTKCVAYLKVSEGPVIASVNLSADNKKLNLLSSNAGTKITTWHYSVDGGETYTDTSENIISGDFSQQVNVYGTDADGKASAIVELTPEDNYYYTEGFTDSSQVLTKTIEKDGYYYFQVWGASETMDKNLGGYANGYVYLKANDILYLNVGAMPQNNSWIAINGNDINHQAIIAGGKSASYVYTAARVNSHPSSNVALTKDYYLSKATTYKGTETFISPTEAAEKGHAGNGYIKISYIGQSLN